MAFGLQAQAATLTPTTTADDGSAGALRQVLAAAVASAQDDVIQLNGQTYVLTQGQLTVSGGGLLRFQGPGTIQRDANAGDFRILAVNSGQTVELDQLTITGGRGGRDDSGGGIFNNGTLRISASTISGNQTTRFNGGGIYNQGNLSLIGSTVTGNMSNAKGGGLYNNGGQVSLIRSTVSYNTTGGNQFGGGISTYIGGSVTLTDSTVTGNTSRFGGGIDVEDGNTLNLNRSLIAGNTAPDGRELYSLNNATINANNYNLIGYGGNAGLSLNSGVTFNGTYYTSSNSPSTPPAGTDFTPSQGIDQILSATLASNGGPTQTHALVANSPAINAVASGCPAGATDQRGVLRPASSGCDVGAFEFSGSYVVNSTADTDDGTCDAGNCTLREAISAANAATGVPAVISLPANSTFTLLAASTQSSDTGLPPVTSLLTIEANGSTIRRDPSAPAFRILAVADGGNLTLRSATISGGQGSTNVGGAGLFVSGGGTLSLVDSTVSANSAGRNNSGGGIQSFGALSVVGSTIAGNSSSGNTGGGLSLQGGSASLLRSTVSGNTAGFGAGIQIGGVQTVTVTASTVTGNTANIGGGGLLVSGGQLTLTDSTVTGNTANEQFPGGGGAYVEGGQITAVRSLIAGNRAPSRSQSAELRLNGGTFTVNNYNLIGFSGVANAEGLSLGATDFTPSQGIAQILNTTLGSNGGTTQTHALVSGSPALDAAGTGCSGTDQRGIPRPQGTACDVGAYEARQGNLQASMTASNALIPVGATTTFTLSARNLAAAADTGGTLTDTVPSRLRIDSVTQNNSLCTTNGQTVSCLLPSLAQNDVTTVSIATTALSAGDASNTATVKTGADVDTDPSDNSSSATVSITPPGTPTLSTSATSAAVGGSISDAATLSGGYSPTGSISFSLYGANDASCSGAPIFISSNKPLSGGKASSDGFTATAAGSYHWIARYSGDSFNAVVSGACNDANETSVVDKASPAIASTASAPVTLGAAISDSASLSGGSSPGGSVTFSLYGPGNPTCSGAPVFTGNGTISGNSASSGSFTPTAAGAYNWIASYGGDSNNKPVTGACGAANESVFVSKLSPSISSSASSAAIGSAVFDSATLSGTSSPGGNLTFTLYAASDSTCTGTPVFTGSNALSGNSATSGSFRPTAAGSYRWIASYAGDANNNPVTGACNAANETSTIAKASPTIGTSAAPSVTVGSPINDNAILTGGSSPGGSVTFTLYGPNDLLCATTPVFTRSATLNGNNAGSGNFTPTLPGTYRWVASYGGDGNNNRISGGCGDANEASVVVKASPTLGSTATPSVTIGSTIADSASLSGGYQLSGNISFALYAAGDSNCTGAPVFTSTVAVNGAGNYVSGSFTPAAVGTYRWIASYAGDANNKPVPGVCNAPNEASTILKATPTVTTSATANIVFDDAIADTASLSGGYTPSGTVTFAAYGPNNTSCTGAPAFTSTQSLGGGGAGSGNFTPATAGTYRWIATYNGDASNNVFSGLCNAANETSTVARANSALVTKAVAPVPGAARSLTTSPSATLKDARTGLPLAGRTLRFTGGTRALCSATTNASGVASCTTTLTNLLGGVLNFGYTGNFDGDTNYNPSANTGPLVQVTIGN